MLRPGAIGAVAKPALVLARFEHKVIN